MKDAAFQLNEWLVEPARNRLSRDGESIALENKTMDTLVFLAARSGDVVSADDIIAEVWGGQPMGENPVYKSIANLRKALGDDPKSPLYIETISRRGYRLVANVLPAENAKAAPGSRTKARRWRRLAYGGIALLAVLLGIQWLWPSADTADRNTTETTGNLIAVLPFENLSGDTNNERFCRGITEELLNHLAEIPTLSVVARQSAFAVTAHDSDPVELAARLGVRYLLTGSVRANNNTYRVAARLLDASGIVLWSDEYNRNADNILSIQNDIAAAVVDGLSLSVTDSFRAHAVASSNFEAYTAYVLGREYLQRRPEGWTGLAAASFEEALRLDPEFAGAYAGLAMAQLHRTRIGETDLAEQQALIDRALELDPNLAEAHAAAGLLQMNLSAFADYEAAIAHLQRALEINPSSIDARNWMSISYNMLGERQKAIRVLEEALALDPLNPVLGLNLGVRYEADGRFDMAREQMRRVLEFPDAPIWGWQWLSNLEKRTGRYDTAIDQLREAIDAGKFGASPTRWEAAELAISYAELGLFDEANSWSELAQLDDSSTWKLNQYYLVHMPQANYAEFQQQLDRFSATQESEASWPVWPRFVVGSYLSRQGDNEGVIRMLGSLYEGGLPAYNGPGGGRDIIDPAHHLALAYLETGEEDKAETLLGFILEEQAEQRRGRTRLLGQALAREAVTYSMLGRTELATTRMLDAIAAGWRRYYMAATNPCYEDLFRQPRVQAALADVRNDLDLQRERVRSADRLTPIKLPDIRRNL
jgi:TolB-like protein/DNA-binding winged helix-turn-helix (wHTH) protein